MNIDRTYPKVFCIGGPKTGTTSVHRALKRLGFKHKTWDRELWDRYKSGHLDVVFAVADQFESFDDGPWNNDTLYQELDRRYPGSKFILTKRESSSWIRSHEAHFSAVRLRERPYLLWCRRYSEATKNSILERYHARNREIESWFANRPDQLLILDVCGGEGWEKLCPFLGLPEPAEPFPQENVTAKRPKTTARVWRQILADWRALARRKMQRLLPAAGH